MRGTVKSAAKPAKLRTRQLAGNYPPAGGQIVAVMRRFRVLFPQKTAMELALRTGANLSHCERCLAGKRELGATFLQKLLQSDVGRDVLIALMGEAKPAWWRGFRRHLKIAETRKLQAELQRRIEQLELEAGE